MPSNTTSSAETAIPNASRDRVGAAWLARPGAKHALLGLGWLCVGLGMVGVVVPGLPTTIFLIVALWAFSKSSDRFHDWLYNHARFGPSLRAWSEHRVIPIGAKLLAVGLMATSWLIVTFLVADSWAAPAALGAVLLGVAGYILTRPDKPPA